MPKIIIQSDQVDRGAGRVTFSERVVAAHSHTRLVAGTRRDST